MIKLFQLIVILAIVISCLNTKANKVDFIITNNSLFPIDSLELTNWNSEITSTNLKISDSIKLQLDFKDVDIKGDGSYFLKYRINGMNKTKDFGYYSNGSPVNSKYYIEILNDTILVREKSLN